MTLQHFNKLSQHQQHQALILQGIYLNERQTEDMQALLFKLNGFYVEVDFARQEDDVLRLRSFAGPDDWNRN